MRRYIPHICLSVFLGLFCLGAVLRWCCFCDGHSRFFCFKCGHWAYQCPRFWPRDEFGFHVVHFRPSCLITQKYRPLRPKRGPLFDCPTCGVNNAVSPSTFFTNSIIEGGR